MIAESEIIEVTPLRRRHLRGVLRIERAVYSQPWSHGLFVSELALRNTRTYFVARVGSKVVGYGGLMEATDEGHITTLAVDPEWTRRGIATRLLISLFESARSHGTADVTLEVRVSNLAAQACYRNFGFVPAGMRKNYYPDTKEDALIMWVHEVDTPAYGERLESLAERLGPVRQ